MPLKIFVFGPSGSGKSTYFISACHRRIRKIPTEEFHSARTGTVHNADAEGSGQYASETRYHEYRCTEFCKTCLPGI